MGCIFCKYSFSPESERLKQGKNANASSKPKPNSDTKNLRTQSIGKRVGISEVEANKATVVKNGVRVSNAGERAISRGEKNEIGNVSKRFVEEKIVKDELVDGWPRWLVDNIPSKVLAGLVPKSADSYEKLAKIGHGTYSNVYKARDKDTRKIVALKKVRFDTTDSESIKFMAREIMILQTLDHPNVIKLEGLATSRMQYSLYLVFEFMHSDLTRIISRPGERLTEAQIKCYMQQLLCGLQYCHDKGVMHRDIKSSNLLIDKRGVLKIADFGLANSFALKNKGPLTNRVVTLWYRSPELLLGSTDYGFAIDLWSAGCLLAEMFVGRPIMPGRTEIEQLHMIFKHFGSPSDDYWKKLKLKTSFRPRQHYKPNYEHFLRDYPSSSHGLLTTLLDLDPSYRGSAESALQSEFFQASPLACDLSALPVIYKDEHEHEHTRRVKRNRALKKCQSFQPSNVRQSGKSQTAEHSRKSSELFKEDKNVEPKMQGQETSNSGSSNSLTSLSSENKGPKTEIHPNALKNVKNHGNTLLQASVIDIMNRNEGHEFSHLRRSISMLNFRHDPDMLSNLYPLNK